MRSENIHLLKMNPSPHCMLNENGPCKITLQHNEYCQRVADTMAGVNLVNRKYISEEEVLSIRACSVRFRMSGPI